MELNWKKVFERAGKITNEREIDASLFCCDSVLFDSALFGIHNSKSLTSSTWIPGQERGRKTPQRGFLQCFHADKGCSLFLGKDTNLS